MQHRLVNNIRYEIHHGALSERHIAELLPLRLTVFYDYPYLFSSTPEHETKRWKAIPQQDSIILVLAYNNDTLVGGLLAYAEDPAHHPVVSQLPNYNSSGSLYLELIMVVPTHQNRGIEREMLSIFEPDARNRGYTDIYDITVVRSQHHPFGIENTHDEILIYQNMGFKQMHLYDVWNWPTRCGVPGNEFVAPIDNMVQYWHKKLPTRT